mgnify:CR=1 FL=1
MIKILENLGTGLFGIVVVLFIGGMFYLPFHIFFKDKELDETYNYHIWVKGVGNYRTNEYKVDGKCLTFTTHKNEDVVVCGSEIEIRKTH